MNPTKEQQAAIESESQNVLVLAGPGTGKTALIVKRVKRLIEGNVNPKHVEVVAYTISAATELQRRIKDTIGVDVGFVGTLHGMMLSMLRGDGQNLIILSERESKELLAEMMHRTGYKKHHGVEKLNAVIRMGPQYFETHDKSTKQETTAYAFWKHQSDNGLANYDALLYAGLNYLRRTKDAETYRYLLVDEFQDAARIDLDIYAELECVERFYVGDFDQAVFGFRHPEPSIKAIKRLASRFAVYRLESTFRCATAICDAANRLIAHNADRLPKELKPVREERGRVDIEIFETDEVEENRIVRDIQYGLNGTVAILCQTNDQCRRWAYLLNDKGVAVALRRQLGEGLPEGWDILRTTLNFFAQPESDYLAFQFLKTLKTWSLQNAEEARQDAITQKKSINEYRIGFPKNAQTDPESMRGYMDAHTQVPLATVDWLCEKLKDSPAGLSMQDVNLLVIDHESQESATKADITARVSALTIWSAKGLQFDTVYLPAWNEGVFPKGNDDFQEARRTAFVGITRAKSSVVITAAHRRRTYHDGIIDFSVSRFVKELYGNQAI